MAKLKESKVVDKLGDDSEEVIPFTYSITSYGADYTIDSLVKRMRQGDIYVPSFQRSFVWNIKQASRFVESLLLGLPVPGIFLSKEEDTQKLLVIDGQQRLRTLQYFFEGFFKKKTQPFSLRRVQPKFEGLTYKTLGAEDRRRLHDQILHATVVKQDVPSGDDSSIYYIFERLNTGGSQLQPQEIRASIYHGPLNDLLGELNKSKDWRTIYGPVSGRMRDQELLLRFLALYFGRNTYARPMRSFLNAYMGKNRRLKLQSRAEIVAAFSPTIATIREALGKEAFKPKRALNAAAFDAVMIGVARRLSSGSIKVKKEVRRQYRHLLANQKFIVASSKSTADEDNVKTRLKLAIKAFASVR
jgi:uncharacterized protein DUF262